MTTDVLANYQELKNNFNKCAIGAPESPDFDKIFMLLFTSEEASVASCLNYAPGNVKKNIQTLWKRD